MSDLLTVQDVARICRLHEVTVRRHIAAGRLRSVSLGRAVRVRAEDLDAFIGEAPTVPGSPRPTSARKARGRGFTMDDPFWALVGAFDDPGGEWVSGDIHRALADAAAAKP